MRNVEATDLQANATRSAESTELLKKQGDSLSLARIKGAESAGVQLANIHKQEAQTAFTTAQANITREIDAAVASGKERTEVEKGYVEQHVANQRTLDRC